MVMDSGKYGALAMTSEELDAFIAESDQIMLASLRKDGSPFVIPIGFDWDGTSFFVTMGHERGGVYRLRRDPRVSLCAASTPAFPTKFVIAEGIAHELDDPDNAVSRGVLLRASSETFAASGIDTEKFMESWLAIGRVAFRIEVTNLVTFDGTKTPKGQKYTSGVRLPTDSGAPS